MRSHHFNSAHLERWHGWKTICFINTLHRSGLGDFLFCFFFYQPRRGDSGLWCAVRCFDTPSLGFIPIPDNPRETLCRAFTRKHKFESLTKRMRRKICKRGGRETIETDSWGSFEQSSGLLPQPEEAEPRPRKRNRRDPSHCWILESGRILVLVLSGEQNPLPVLTAG